MSCFFIVGIFALGDAHRVATNRLGSTSKLWHFHYTTTVRCSSGTIIPANIRVYSPRDDTGLQNLTIAFVVAKVYAPVNEAIQLDAQYIVPFPGDPNHEDYEDAIPDMQVPFVFGVGHVAKKSEVMPDGQSKGFPVSLSDYVRDSVRHSTIQCFYDGSSIRWAKTPTPNPQSCIHIFGLCDAITAGLLTIKLNAITLNLCPLVLNHVLSPAKPPLSQSPNKRRKFQTHASSSTTVSPMATKSASHVAPLGSPSLHTSQIIPSIDVSSSHNSPDIPIAGPSRLDSLSGMATLVSEPITSITTTYAMTPIEANQSPVMPTDNFYELEPLTPEPADAGADALLVVPSDFPKIGEMPADARRKPDRKKGKARAT